KEDAIVAAFYKITGRKFQEIAPGGRPGDSEAGQQPTAEGEPDAEAVERVSRYNFDELSRILTDRVGERKPRPPEVTQSVDLPVPSAGTATTGSLVNLGGETLVLNRLPLGILVFRGQQVLFANRAITEMIGYDSVESLRQA